MNRQEVLVNYFRDKLNVFSITVDDVVETYSDDTFEVLSETGEFLVLTDEEANDKVFDSIRDSLWAFNSEFIASHARIGLNAKAVSALARMQGELCESANDLIYALIKNMGHFVKDAVKADGRGHFLASYDFEEHEQNGYFIYRVN